MAISRVGGSFDYTTDVNGTPLSVAWPAGHQSGDLAILIATKNSDTNNLVMDSTGWTLNGTLSNTAAGDDRAWGTWIRLATSSSEAAVEVSSAEATYAAAAMIVLRGVDQTNPLDVTPRAGGLTSLTLNPTPPSQTSVTDHVAVVVAQMAVTSGNENAIAAAGAPSGYTLDTDATDVSNTGVEAVVAYLLDAGTAGVEAPGAFTNTDGAGANPSNACFTFLVRPAADSGATVTPAAISVTVTLPAPAVAVQAAPAAISAPVTLPAATAMGGATVSPAAISVTASLPAPTVETGAAPAPAAVAVPITLPAPAVTVEAAPASIPVPVTLPAPTAGEQAGSGATVEPAAISALVSLPAPAVTVGAAPAVIQASSSVAAPEVTVGAAPSSVAVPVSLPAPAVAVEATPAAISVPVTLPAPSATGGATRSPGAISAVVTLPSPQVTVGAAPAVISVVTTLPSPDSVGEVGDSPHPITLEIRDSGHTATIADEGHTATIRSRGYTAMEVEG